MAYAPEGFLLPKRDAPSHIGTRWRTVFAAGQPMTTVLTHPEGCTCTSGDRHLPPRREHVSVMVRATPTKADTMNPSRPRRTYVVGNLVRKPPKSDPSWACVRTDAGVDNLVLGVGVLVSGLFQYDNIHMEGVAAAHGCQEPPTSDYAELLAVYHGLLLARSLGYSSAHVVTDSQYVRHVISGGKVRHGSEVHSAMSFLMPLLGVFDKVSLKWVPRENNREADSLARKARRDVRRALVSRTHASLAESADAAGSNPVAREGVLVQVQQDAQCRVGSGEPGSL